MNRNLVLIALVIITGASGYLLLNLDGTANTDREQADTVMSSETAPAHRQTAEHDVSGSKKRIAAMRAAYAELEQARDTVRRQLGRLKSRTWKLRVSPEQARAITEQMQQGYAILKNPPMLGAFSSVAEIRQELGKVTRAADKLSALETTVREHIAAQEAR